MAFALVHCPVWSLDCFWENREVLVFSTTSTQQAQDQRGDAVVNGGNRKSADGALHLVDRIGPRSAGFQTELPLEQCYGGRSIKIQGVDVD